MRATVAVDVLASANLGDTTQIVNSICVALPKVAKPSKSLMTGGKLTNVNEPYALLVFIRIVVVLFQGRARLGYHGWRKANKIGANCVTSPNIAEAQISRAYNYRCLWTRQVLQTLDAVEIAIAAKLRQCKASLGSYSDVFGRKRQKEEVISPWGVLALIPWGGFRLILSLALLIIWKFKNWTFVTKTT